MVAVTPDSETVANTVAKPPPATEADPANPLHNAFWRRDRKVVDANLKQVCPRPLTFYPGFEFTGELESVRTPGAWLVTRHATILEVSRNPQVFSSSSGVTINDFPPEFNEYFNSIIAMDDPRHARLRRLVSAGFTPRMLDRLENSIHEQAKLIVDEVCEQGKCDFVTDVAARLPLRIVCDLMGIPASEHDFVFDQTNVILGAADEEYVPEATDLVTAILEAGAALTELMDEVAESKVGVDTGDLTSILVNAEVDGERLTRAELASFFVLLVVAGNETTRNSTSWGLVYLTDYPDQRRIWTEDFDGVAASAVEEIVRLASPVSYMRRTALCDTELEGQKIDEGDMVAMSYICANRDDSVFDNPDEFNVLRDPNPHIGFGGPGPHFCLGAHLARRQIKVMFGELFSRIGDIHATGEPVPLSSGFIHGIKHLPAEFTPTRMVGASA
ncbi:cytochrome P450 [Candidatus Poriferisocius sp.]|uniref:cytochrome P450 n=1 Tax=Candidatus Poriferisocius sp. TaxID=3101276 RepID=UPI003B016710